MIILTSEQAEEVRGRTGKYSALEPRELIDGTFVLPEAVLTDPAHEMHHDYLAALPTRVVAAEEYPASE